MNPLKLLWSFDGRIGRSAYAGGLLLNLVVMLIAPLIFIVLYLEKNWAPSTLLEMKHLHLIPVLAMVALFSWALVALAAKRLHDLGVTGWFSLLMIVHGANLIMIIVLLIARGEDNDNRYGPGTPSTGAPVPA